MRRILGAASPRGTSGHNSLHSAPRGAGGQGASFTSGLAMLRPSTSMARFALP